MAKESLIIGMEKSGIMVIGLRGKKKDKGHVKISMEKFTTLASF